MSYAAIPYYIMIILTAILYYILPKKIRWIALLISSGYFYDSVSDNRVQLMIFGISILAGYTCGIFIKKGHDRQYGDIASKCILTTGIVVSVLPLVVSKCGDLLLVSVLHKSSAGWILPVGLSFYSMQTVAYLTDIYHGKIEPQKNILKYTLFITFFPLIIQGPISRYDQLGEQLFEGHSYDDRQIMRGIQLILWGWGLKYLIADKAAIFVNAVFDNYQIYSGLFILIAGILYSIQLYTDFLSCVTISQGVSELFGIKLTDNFRHPYFSVSIKDFWRRWHMSLSAWLRDYVYIPLGGNRRGKIRKYMNLIITFAVSGLWHGGRWKYIFWGLLHAFYQIAGEILEKPVNFILEKASLPKGSKMRKFVEMVFTSFLVMNAWIIFRAESLKAGVKMIRSMFSMFNPWILFDNSLFRLGLSQKEFEVLFLAVLLLTAVSALQEKGIKIREWFNKQNMLIRWTIYLCSIWIIWIFGTYGFGFNSADFIYGGF